MDKQLTFEQANKELEEIVKKMEKGDITLEECMKLYEQAFVLLNYCTDKLEQYKGEIVDIDARIEKMKTQKQSLFED